MLNKKSFHFLLLILVFTVSMTQMAGCKENDPGGNESISKENSIVSQELTGSIDEISFKTENLMNGFTTNEITGMETDDVFKKVMANFALKLFKNTINEKENSLVSPLSVMLALAMTANGAEANTLAQMESLLGDGLPLDTLNKYLLTYVKKLPNDENSKFKSANSIWFNQNDKILTVEKDFLQKNADYYGAAAYKSPFNEQTVKDINDWVKINTDNMIDKIVEKIDQRNLMFLINAIVFDAEWNDPYMENNFKKNNVFTAENGEKQIADYMYSMEDKYIETNNAIGFMKPYKNNKYSFVAMLPNDGISIKKYIATLSGDAFLKMINESSQTSVSTMMPKFSYEYSIEMRKALKTLGIPDAFDANNANFKKLGKSSSGNLFIGGVLHKTFISVDMFGTRAGAVTNVYIKAGGMSPPPKTVKLDRPFVYAIIDNATSLPIFIGTLMSLE